MASRARPELRPVAVGDKVSRRVSAFAAAASADVHDAVYYGKCMVGGLLSCGLTHTAIVPLDIVKCRMQVCAR